MLFNTIEHFFFLLIEESRKIYCQILNKLNINESVGIMTLRKLTLLTGNLKAVCKNCLLL